MPQLLSTSTAAAVALGVVVVGRGAGDRAGRGDALAVGRGDVVARAAAPGRDDIGALCPGCRADFAVFAVEADPYAALVGAAGR